MAIVYDATRRTYLLQAGDSTYALGINAAGRPVHLYWGARLEAVSALDGIDRDRIDARGVSQDSLLRQEYRVQEPFDYGEPALLCTFADGVHSVRLHYQSHQIEDNTLVLTLADDVYPLSVTLWYRLYGDLPLIGRWAVVRNEGETPITVRSAQSATWHLPAAEPYRLTHLSGSWGAEYQRQRLDMTQSKVLLENRRLTCAAHQQVPFFALDARGEATETAGEVYFGVLHWSGDFKLAIEQNNLRQLSVCGGMHDAPRVLHPGEALQTPACTSGFTGGGFEAMTRALYDWQYDHLLPREKAADERPVIYNSWYPYQFNVCEENMLGLVDRAADIGTELFVIDDGWMPGRTSDACGLGDWAVDMARFPRGLRPIADACHAKGMRFGLWVEPEMVNPDSDLYRAHPDWMLTEATRPRTECRRQLVLNLARDDIRDWAISWLDALIGENSLDYVKWDMNRYATEIGAVGGDAADSLAIPQRYIENLYAIWAHLNERHPHVLFENCASGGGRTDFGMVPYADRINRSDNADPVDVMQMHEGFTMLFVPKTAGGAGNISPSPNGINGRDIPLDFRIHSGMTGSLSVGINLLTAPPAELDALREAVARYKQIRGDLQDAYVYRIASAFDHPYSVLQYLRRDGSAFSVFAFGHGMRFWQRLLPRFRMRGLDPDALYRGDDGICLRGDALMHLGLDIPLRGDYASRFLHFTRVTDS